MRYFLDFEGTQFEKRIISIGVVAEDGHNFYSIVKPRSKYKITSLIEELTGLTKEDIESAPSIEEVLNDLYDWILEREESIDEVWKPEWYCWGDEDISFIQNTFRDIVDYPTARLVLGDMAGGLVNYCNKFCNMYGIKQRALIKVAKSFDHTKEQDHNALSDAELLRFVFISAQQYDKGTIKKKVAHLKEVEEAKPSPKWTESELPKGTIVTISNSKKVKHSFESYTDAASWLIKEKKIDGVTVNAAAKKIEFAAKNRQKYYISWRIIGE